MKIKRLVYAMLFFLFLLSISTGLNVFADCDESAVSEEILDGGDLNDGNIKNDLTSLPPVVEGEDGNGNSALGLPPIVEDEDGNGNSALGLPPIVDDHDGNGNSPLNNPTDDEQVNE